MLLRPCMSSSMRYDTQKIRKKWRLMSNFQIHNEIFFRVENKFESKSITMQTFSFTSNDDMPSLVSVTANDFKTASENDAYEERSTKIKFGSNFSHQHSFNECRSIFTQSFDIDSDPSHFRMQEVYFDFGFGNEASESLQLLTSGEFVWNEKRCANSIPNQRITDSHFRLMRGGSQSGMVIDTSDPPQSHSYSGAVSQTNSQDFRAEIRAKFAGFRVGPFVPSTGPPITFILDDTWAAEHAESLRDLLSAASTREGRNIAQTRIANLLNSAPFFCTMEDPEPAYAVYTSSTKHACSFLALVQVWLVEWGPNNDGVGIPFREVIRGGVDIDTPIKVAQCIAVLRTIQGSLAHSPRAATCIDEFVTWLEQNANNSEVYDYINLSFDAGDLFGAPYPPNLHERPLLPCIAYFRKEPMSGQYGLQAHSFRANAVATPTMTLRDLMNVLSHSCKVGCNDSHYFLLGPAQTISEEAIVSSLNEAITAVLRKTDGRNERASQVKISDILDASTDVAQKCCQVIISGIPDKTIQHSKKEEIAALLQLAAATGAIHLTEANCLQALQGPSAYLVGTGARSTHSFAIQCNEIEVGSRENPLTLPLLTVVTSGILAPSGRGYISVTCQFGKKDFFSASCQAAAVVRNISAEGCIMDMQRRAIDRFLTFGKIVNFTILATCVHHEVLFGKTRRLILEYVFIILSNDDGNSIRARLQVGSDDKPIRPFFLKNVQYEAWGSVAEMNQKHLQYPFFSPSPMITWCQIRSDIPMRDIITTLLGLLPPGEDSISAIAKVINVYRSLDGYYVGPKAAIYVLYKQAARKDWNRIFPTELYAAQVGLDRVYYSDLILRPFHPEKQPPPMEKTKSGAEGGIKSNSGKAPSTVKTGLSTRRPVTAMAQDRATQERGKAKPSAQLSSSFNAAVTQQDMVNLMQQVETKFQQEKALTQQGLAAAQVSLQSLTGQVSDCMGAVKALSSSVELRHSEHQRNVSDMQGAIAMMMQSFQSFSAKLDQNNKQNCEIMTSIAPIFRQTSQHGQHEAIVDSQSTANLTSVSSDMTSDAKRPREGDIPTSSL